MADKASYDPPVLYRRRLIRSYDLLVSARRKPSPRHTECRSMRGRIRIQRIHTHDLIVGTRCQVFPMRRESDRVDGARVMADGCQLLRLRIFGVSRVEDSLGRPYSDVSICGGSIYGVLGDGASRGSSAASGSTNLQQQLLTAVHQARRGSCILRSL